MSQFSRYIAKARSHEDKCIGLAPDPDRQHVEHVAVLSLQVLLSYNRNISLARPLVAHERHGLQYRITATRMQNLVAKRGQNSHTGEEGCPHGNTYCAFSSRLQLR
jgi:hypothetical protein